MLGRLGKFLRRFRFPVVIGELENLSKTDAPDTTLLSLRDYFPPDPATRTHATVVVAYPTAEAKRMPLRESFLIVCSPVNFRKDPAQRSGIIALPLPTDKSLRPDLAA